MADLIEYHCDGCGCTFKRSASNACFVCGAPAKRTGVAIVEAPKASPPVAPIDPLAATFAAWRVYKAVKWFAGAGVALVVGLWLLFDRNLRTDPSRFTFSDAAAGLAAVAAGLGMLTLGVWAFRRGRK